MSMIQSRPARKISNRPSVAIVGAGIGGLTLALRLAEVGFAPVVFEARARESAAREGVFLTLAPNGMNGLRTVGCYDAVKAAGIPTLGIEIRNSRGKRLALVDQTDHESRFGAPSTTVGRGVLADILARRALDVGIDLRFGVRVGAVTQEAAAVELTLDSGEAFRADIVIAADGLRSTVRELAFPDYPKPQYTGLIGTGGLIDVPVASTDGVMVMTFGDNTFFGYIKADGKPAYWFNSYSAPATEAANIGDPKAYARRVAALHRDDPAPNATILDAVSSLERNYPVYDVPPLPTWHRGRVVLLGDAAHAVGPHAGQGASMAIEDAVVLSACLESDDAPEAAFARFESLRRDRIAEVVKLTARNSSQKKTSGPIALFIRDLILPLVIPLGIRMGRNLLAHRVDLHPLHV